MASKLSSALKLIMKLYSRAGFTCQTALMDGEFKKMRNKELDYIVINTTLKNEHVGEIERKNYNVKGRQRAIKANMHICILLNSIIKALISYAVIIMDVLPDEQGVS